MMLTRTRIQASLLFVIATFVGLHQHAMAQDVCEICGCDACPAGFVVGNMEGLIEITPEIIDEFGSIEVPPNALNPEPSTLEATLAALGFGVGAMLPCSILNTAATSGIFPIESCTDQLRLNPIIRDTCGCPPVPGPATDAPTAAPTAAPVVAATEAPTAAPTEVPETDEPTAPPTENPTDPPVDEPTDAPVVAPTDPPVDTPTEPPVVAPTDPPVPAPTDAPVMVTATTVPPVPAPTDSPVTVMVTTDPPVMPPPTGGGIPFPELERCTTMRRKRKQ